MVNNNKWEANTDQKSENGFEYTGCLWIMERICSQLDL